MSRAKIIEKTLDALKKLPPNKAEEVAIFADQMVKKNEDQQLLSGIQQLITKSDSFTFLNDEEDLYHMEDLIAKY